MSQAAEVWFVVCPSCLAVFHCPVTERKAIHHESLILSRCAQPSIACPGRWLSCSGLRDNGIAASPGTSGYAEFPKCISPPPFSFLVLFSFLLSCTFNFNPIIASWLISAVSFHISHLQRNHVPSPSGALSSARMPSVHQWFVRLLDCRIPQVLRFFSFLFVLSSPDLSSVHDWMPMRQRYKRNFMPAHSIVPSSAMSYCPVIHVLLSKTGPKKGVKGPFQWKFPL